MEIANSDIKVLAEAVATAVVDTLEKRKLFGNAPKQERSAYQKTEQLLFNYNGFKRVIAERMEEIEELKKYGVPKQGGAVVQYGGNSGGTPAGIVLPEETVDRAVHTVLDSVHDTVQAVSLIDKAMQTLKSDPYYNILEMRYFEGRTQEDIAVEFGCTQQAISQQKNRLVKDLSMKIFPNQVVRDIVA